MRISLKIRLRITQAMAHGDRLITLTQQPVQHVLYQHLTCLIVNVVAYNEEGIGRGGCIGKCTVGD